MPDKVKRKTQVATNKNRQREPEFNTYLDFPLNIIEGLVNFRSLWLTLTRPPWCRTDLDRPGWTGWDGLRRKETLKSTFEVFTFSSVGFESNG